LIPENNSEHPTQAIVTLPPPPPPPPPTLPAVGPPPVVNIEEYRGVLRGEFEWVRDNVPHFECSDGEITMAYWYRCVWPLSAHHDVSTTSLRGGFVSTQKLAGR